MSERLRPALRPAPLQQGSVSGACFCRVGLQLLRRYKPIAELIDQLNRLGDFAILSTAKTKIALADLRGSRALTDGLNRGT
jgi:hypothetical protein